MANENYFFTSFISIIFRANRTVDRASAKATYSASRVVSCRSFCVVRTVVSTVSCTLKQSGISSTMIQSIFCYFISVFYDIGSPKARAENQELKINVNLNKRSVWETRLWEIRISQIPFSSKPLADVCSTSLGLKVNIYPTHYHVLTSNVFCRSQASYKPSISPIMGDIWQTRTTGRACGRRKESVAFSTSRATTTRSESGR